jgi:hypothetical protein
MRSILSAFSVAFARTSASARARRYRCLRRQSIAIGEVLERRFALATLPSLSIGGITEASFLDAPGSRLFGDTVTVRISGAAGAASFFDKDGGPVDDGDEIGQVVITGASPDFHVSYSARVNQPLVPPPLPPAPGEFSITLSYDAPGDFTQEQRDLIDTAVDRWESIIRGDLASVVDPTYGVIDDIVVTVQRGLLGGGNDGEGGTLANAIPLEFRDAGAGLPYLAAIGLDPDDLGSPELLGIVVHEFGHALGFASAAPVFQGNKLGDFFVGPNAVREYVAIFPATADPNGVPLETSGGPGTAGAHWSEDVFQNEIMTGYVGTDMPLSRLTIGAFEDMGYAVDYGAADSVGSDGIVSMGAIQSDRIIKGIYSVKDAGSTPEVDFVLGGFAGPGLSKEGGLFVDVVSGDIVLATGLPATSSIGIRQSLEGDLVLGTSPKATADGRVFIQSATAGTSIRVARSSANAGRNSKFVFVGGSDSIGSDVTFAGPFGGRIDIAGSTTGKWTFVGGVAPGATLNALSWNEVLVQGDFAGRLNVAGSPGFVRIVGNVSTEGMLTGGQIDVRVTGDFAGTLQASKVEVDIEGSVRRLGRLIATAVGDVDRTDDVNFRIGGMLQGTVDVGVFDGNDDLAATVLLVGRGVSSSGRFNVGSFADTGRTYAFGGDFLGNLRVLGSLPVNLQFRGRADRVTIGGNVLADISVAGRLAFLQSNSFFQPSIPGTTGVFRRDPSSAATGTLTTTGGYKVVLPKLA